MTVIQRRSLQRNSKLPGVKISSSGTCELLLGLLELELELVGQNVFSKERWSKRRMTVAAMVGEYSPPRVLYELTLLPSAMAPHLQTGDFLSL